ncbi:competence-specific regulator [Alteromonadales bacterium alter-6D02]|nr:competence-specific regulator [Alteromonadales bacterium alter-6D02]
MIRLRDLQGLGPKSEAMLIEAGVNSVSQLQHLGAIAVYIKVSKYQGKPPSLNLLYALVGPLEDEHWLSIAQSQKAQLIMQLEDYQTLEQLFNDQGKSLTL